MVRDSAATLRSLFAQSESGTLKTGSAWNTVLAVLYVLLYTYNKRTGNNGKGLRGARKLPGCSLPRGAKASAGTDAGVAGRLQADQEGSAYAPRAGFEGIAPESPNHPAS
jgi:hypothetical protein